MSIAFWKKGGKGVYDSVGFWSFTWFLRLKKIKTHGNEVKEAKEVNR